MTTCQKNYYAGIFICFSLIFTAISQEIRLSDFSPDKENASPAFQKALEVKGSKITFDKPGFVYYLDPTSISRSDLEIVLEDGVEIVARKGAFKTGGVLLRFQNAKNIAIRGQGNAKIRMNKADYQNLKLNRPSEHRHAIAISGCENVEVSDLSIASSGGDGVYIGGDAMAKNIWLHNLFIDNHHRQGISVINVDKLLIENCTIANTRGTPPESGIDFEPNRTDECLKNIIVKNCKFINNKSAAISIALFYSLKAPISITVQDCLMQDNGGGFIFDMAGNSTPIKGFVKVKNTKIISPENSFSPLVITSQRDNGTQISFENTTIDNRFSDKSAININSKHSDNIGGLDFGQMRIEQNGKSEIFNITALGASGLLPFGGKIIQVRDNRETEVDFTPYYKKYTPNTELKTFKTDKLDLDLLAPAFKEGKPENALYIRGANTFLQYAKKGQPVHLTFSPLRKNNIFIPVTILNEKGGKIGNFAVKSEHFIYHFLAPEDGMYQFNVSSYNPVAIQSSAPGCGFKAEQLNLFGGRNNILYFSVPAATDKVLVKISTQPGEPVSAELVDAAGNVRFVMPYQDGTCILHATRTPTDKPETWAVKIIKVVEDFSIHLGAPICPIVFTSEKNMLETKSR